LYEFGVNLFEFGGSNFCRPVLQPACSVVLG
jgi:hypothetical protein